MQFFPNFNFFSVFQAAEKKWNKNWCFPYIRKFEFISSATIAYNNMHFASEQNSFLGGWVVWSRGMGANDDRLQSQYNFLFRSNHNDEVWDFFSQFINHRNIKGNQFFFCFSIFCCILRWEFQFFLVFLISGKIAYVQKRVFLVIVYVHVAMYAFNCSRD